MNESGYNGWKNYETWCVHLWLSNDEGTYNFCRARARQARRDARDCRQVRERIWERPEAAKFLLADALKEHVEEQSPLADQPSMFSDLLTAAFGEVDWHEVADAFLEAASET